MTPVPAPVHRVLLADDSQHAQRMGESILRDEGFEVVCVTDGQSAVVRIGDFDPDVVLADVDMPFCSGYDLCEFIKNHPVHKRTRVILTAGAHETVDDSRATSSGADGVLKKPFEATALLDMLWPLITLAGAERGAPSAIPNGAPRDAEDRIAVELASLQPWSPHAYSSGARALHPPTAAAEPPVQPADFSAVSRPAAAPPAEPVLVEPAGFDAMPDPTGAPASAAEPGAPQIQPRSADPEQIRAAVTLALDAAMTDLIDKITEKVLVALQSGGNPDSHA